MSKEILFSHLVSAAAGFIRMGASFRDIHTITGLSYLSIAQIYISLSNE